MNYSAIAYKEYSICTEEMEKDSKNQQHFDMAIVVCTLFLPAIHTPTNQN